MLILWRCGLPQNLQPFFHSPAIRVLVQYEKRVDANNNLLPKSRNPNLYWNWIRNLLEPQPSSHTMSRPAAPKKELKTVMYTSQIRRSILT